MKVKIVNANQSVFGKLMLVVLSMTLLLGCGGGAKEENTTSSESGSESTSEEQTEQPSSEAAENSLIKLVINSNDQMRYDQEELRVKAGATVELTLNHTGELAKEVMGHNLVILKPGTDITAFAQKAIAAKDTEYIPEGDEIIIHTKLIGGGESTTITFTAPAAGTYDFICTFPGHYALMKGKFIVE
ncbi:azurin [Fulvivirgaceae bacterium BMA10]|uniref:Azurin n=1 Tax=Splendidivirga corallicola TaxID=3051826 RepID=A0ABT8KP58_9BACT|nr:azurin [Fulvivirgaceae bacterium BMA10]